MALNSAGESLRFLGDYPRALRMQMKALELTRKTNDADGEAGTLGFIGFIYLEFKEYRLGLSYLFPALTLSRRVKNQMLEKCCVGFNFKNIRQIALRNCLASEYQNGCY